MNEGETNNILAVVNRINNAWTTGHVADMAACFHEDIVMAGPGFGAREQGRERCIKGFGEFTQQATIVEFNAHGHQVDVIGDSAVAVYEFELVYVGEDGRHRSTGKDLWVLKKGEAGWQAVWRTILDMDDQVV